MAVVRHSAGLLVHRIAGGEIQVLVGHMGGPFWRRKEVGAWSFPKGEPLPDEDDSATAQREFEEELGIPVPHGDLVDLGEVRQSGGKTVRLFALAAEVDLARFAPGTFELEWPPRSGRRQHFPEIDRAEWCSLELAEERLVTAQRQFLPRLRALLTARAAPDEG